MQSSDNNLSNSPSGGVGGTSISGDALDTLSPEQISALVTSNSVNYEAIQQILAQQNQRSRDSISPPGGSHSGLQQSSHFTEPLGSSGSSNAKSSVPGLKWADPSQMRMCSSSDIYQGGTREGPSILNVQRDPNSSSSSASGLSSPLGPSSPIVVASGSGNGASTSPVFQITMDQLALLQNQVHGLLQAQNVAIPSEVSSDIIQSLILRQLGGTANVLLKENGASLGGPAASASTAATAAYSSTAGSASRSTVGGGMASEEGSGASPGNVALSNSSDSVVDSGLGSSGDLMDGSGPGDVDPPRSPVETQAETGPSGSVEARGEPLGGVASAVRKPAEEVSYQGSGSVLRGRAAAGRGLKRVSGEGIPSDVLKVSTFHSDLGEFSD